ncbi:SMC-Scp complex subunit ScpB [Spiribacter sp. C176]|uniref:SMC-Scp complex subunit ScpB n=1 Tax=Spiribacter salilacus TaxID=2664894 RepID=A0A6N7QM19_9GAMM|nr:SMC-Scp complex subunit ScpB [Spiribacter salilacus]MRH77451.1 SMC-Scp complex subunit ScpB [Spiribacter salilacus]
MSQPSLENILEAVLLAAGEALSMEQLQAVFSDDERPSIAELERALAALESQLSDRGVSLQRVASGYRLQVPESLSPWVSRLWEEKPSRYSRAILETLAIIAYRQPVTRGEIEEIRGVALSTGIMRTLQERGWIRVAGHRDAPGRPGVYATTRAFLDYFNLASLADLPSLIELGEPGPEHPELDLEPPEANDGR